MSSTAKKTPKARKARQKRRLLATKAIRAPEAVLDRVRGSGPPIRNVEVLDQEWSRECGHQGCKRLVDAVVSWKHWHKGAWRGAWRRLCQKHATKIKARLGGARGQR